MKRLLAVVAGLALALVGTMAVAAWLSTGSATATATATSVNQANAPTATRGVGSVGLSWEASTLADGSAVGGYRVLRHHGSDAPVEVCITTSTSCTDTAPIADGVSYGVVATIGTNWRGEESSPTSFTYDDVAPGTTANVSPAPNGAGWNKMGVTVTLTATDGGINSGVNHIRYSVDSGPTQMISGASGSLSVTGAGTHTVTFAAVDNVGNTEVEQHLVVKIDPNAPLTTVTPNPAPNAAGWNKTDVALGFSATDSGTSGIKSVTVDGDVTSGSTVTRTVTSEGIHTVSYFATDNADNVEGAKSVTVKIDKTAPTASIDPAGGTSWTDDNTVAITADDTLSGVASVQYSIDGGALQSYTGPVTLADGTRSFRYVVTDLAGNVTDQTATINVDTVTPSSSSATTTTTTWTITATDAAPSSGVSIEYWVDSGPHTTVSGTSAVVTVEDGSHTIHWFAKDSAGNQETQHNVDVTVVTADTFGPTMTNLDPSDGFDALNNNTSSVNAWVNKACSTGKLCLTIADAAGVNESSISFNLRGTSGSNNGKCWNGVTFATGTSCAVPMSFDSSTGRATSANIPQSAMLDGAYSITYRAKDTLGNETVTMIAVTVN